MDDKAARVIEAALKLPVDARAALAGTLLESLDDVDDDAEAVWAEEIARRLESYDSGRTGSVPWSEARRRILSAE